MKDLFEDLLDCIKEYGILKGMYYSDVFSPIYNLIKLPKRIYNYVDKFIYYGKAGAKTYDFDANSLEHLIYAHIKRVRKFMDSDNTHLVWNSERKKGLIRKLYELEELCKRRKVLKNAAPQTQKLKNVPFFLFFKRLLTIRLFGWDRLICSSKFIWIVALLWQTLQNALIDRLVHGWGAAENPKIFA